MHYDDKVQANEPFKPDLILDYNATKGGVDTLDQLVGNYSCKRITNRWPVVVFYWMIDVAAYNSAVCLTLKEPNAYKGHQKRRLFLTDLSEQLCKPLIERRANAMHKQLPKHIVVCMEAFVDINSKQYQNASQVNRKRRCSKCPRKSDKKTKKSCVKCNEPICEGHAKIV